MKIYAIKPEESTFPEGVEGVVLVDTTNGAYSIGGISFPFVWHDNRWNIDEPVYIGNSWRLPKRFSNNFNSIEAAKKAWGDAKEGKYWEGYLWIPASEFLRGQREKMLNTVKSNMPKNLEFLVQKLEPFHFIGTSLDQNNIPQKIAEPGTDTVLLRYLDSGYNMEKRYLNSSHQKP